jgi:hypothetical protein
MMGTQTGYPFSCEIRSIIRFPHSQSMSCAEVRPELCARGGVLAECNERRNCRTSVECLKMVEQMFTMMREDDAWQSVVSDQLVRSIYQKLFQRRRFTFSELTSEFPQISPTVPYDMITGRLCCHTICARLFPKLLTVVHKMQTIIFSALAF